MRSLVAWANGAICGGGKAGVAAVAAKAEPARKANVQSKVAGRRGINIGQKLKRLTPGKRQNGRTAKLGRKLQRRRDKWWGGCGEGRK